MTERIASAALKVGQAIFSMPPPARHDTLFRNLKGYVKARCDPENQGFLTSTGRYVSREEGLTIAIRENQVIKKYGAKWELYSEDMW